MPEYPRSPFEKTGTSITPNVDGDALDATVIGENTSAAGNFTTLTAATDPTDGSGVGDRDFNDDRYSLGSNNLSDLDSISTAFDNIKQAATESATGVIEKATAAEVVTGTDTDRAVTPAGVTARLEAPGAIGGTTPAAGVFTTLESTGQLQGALINNQMVQKATFDILGLMTDPRFLNLQCEDPGAGTMIDASGQGHDGTYQGSMTSGDRVKNGMGWAVDFDSDDDYISISDNNDLSFGDGINDEAVTWFGVIDIIDGTVQAILSKKDDTTGFEQREYMIYILNTRIMKLRQHDESAGVVSERISTIPIPTGWHTYAITSPGDGGATSMNNVKIYFDGVEVASTANNNASYVAMENLTAPLLIGTYIGGGGVPVSLINGNIALTGIDGSEWSVFDIHRFHQLCKGLYGI